MSTAIRRLAATAPILFLFVAILYAQQETASRPVSIELDKDS